MKRPSRPTAGVWWVVGGLVVLAIGLATAAALSGEAEKLPGAAALAAVFVGANGFNKKFRRHVAAPPRPLTAAALAQAEHKGRSQGQGFFVLLLAGAGLAVAVPDAAPATFFVAAFALFAMAWHAVGLRRLRAVERAAGMAAIEEAGALPHQTSLVPPPAPEGDPVDAPSLAEMKRPYAPTRSAPALTLSTVLMAAACIAAAVQGGPLALALAAAAVPVGALWARRRGRHLHDALRQPDRIPRRRDTPPPAEPVRAVAARLGPGAVVMALFASVGLEAAVGVAMATAFLVGQGAAALRSVPGLRRVEAEAGGVLVIDGQAWPMTPLIVELDPR